MPKCIECEKLDGNICSEGAVVRSILETDSKCGFGFKPITIENVKYPICPINLYFEGDEDKCNATKCDWDTGTRSCNSACQIDQIKLTKQIRKFNTGATRDTNVNKLNYEGFFSPLVLRRYAEYLHKHRVQSDGNLRDADNWQKGIPIKTYMEGKLRHTVATWLIYDGFEAVDEKGNEIDLEESLCAEIFNTMGYLFEILKGKLEK